MNAPGFRKSPFVRDVKAVWNSSPVTTARLWLGGAAFVLVCSLDTLPT